MNQVEALEQAILQHAEEMAMETRKSAEASRRNILRECSERLHLREQKETLLAKSLADRAYLRKVQADELKLRSNLDHMRWNLVQLVIERLTERMRRLRRDEASYDALLQAFLQQAAEQVEGPELLIALNHADRSRLQPQWEAFTRMAAVDKHILLAEAPIETLGGLLASTPEQRIRIDHTFEGRLSRLQNKIQLVVVERLLPPVTNGLSLR
jgi:V/A-type H+-transporting ATPase subunit E